LFCLALAAACAAGGACGGPSARDAALSGQPPIPPPILAIVSARLELLRSSDARVRQEGVLRLAMMGPLARDAFPDLIAALGDSALPVRHAALLALGELGSDARAAVAGLRILLDSPSEDSLFRVLAGRAVRKIERDSLVPAAARNLASGDPATRLDAATLLARFAPDALEAVPPLIAALGDSSHAVRRLAIRALGAMAFRSESEDGYPNPTVIAALNRSAEDPDERVRDAAATELGVIRMVLRAGEPAMVGDLDESIRQFAQITRAAPSQYGARLQLGMLQLVAGDRTGAFDSFNAALTLVPGNAAALLGRGRVHAVDGDAEAALVDVTRALLFGGESAEARYVRAQLYHGKGEYDLAMEDLNVVVRFSADTLQRQMAHFLRAHIYSQRNNPERGLAAADSALSEGPFAPGHFARAINLEQLGRTAEADSAYRRFAESRLPEQLASLREIWLDTRARLGYPAAPRP
jgi:HEAT repeat protein/Tfp pilus assembly protein PilF